GTILGLIGRKAHLVNPTHCIGHGACQKACPHDAITLVFGTAERGVDIPEVKPNFETNVPGIFIAGELGGMGLIRNAIEQGRQAMEAIKKRKGNTNQLDVVIIGAGPAGYSASLNALNHKLRFTTIEQETLGGTVAHFPRGKIVMTQPAVLPMVGKVRFRETTKETLLGFWKEVEKKTGIKINYNERMEEIKTNANGFTVTTTKNVYTTRNILLAIGRRGTPRKLGVSGEELPKVVYRLVDPEQYRGQHVLVVGGGDAALEAAISIAEQPDTTVTLSYRSDAFSRAKEKNRRKITDMNETGQLTLLMKSNVTRIDHNMVTLEQQGKTIDITNNAVIISAGGVLPTPFLKNIGINVNTKYGTV
ncbi:MAG: NAD(P)-binding domain-containing protein, partial [Gammaproteobacteria bacterium]|nr:NAD(P)-binding domain-containing protein [Gammaproteobacteria bacterium]